MATQNSFFKKGVSDLFTVSYNATWPVVIHQGGTSSGKTWSLMQLLLVIAITEPNRIITVVGQDSPSLRRGPFRDLERILNLDPHLKGYIVGGKPNNTFMVYKFFNGSIIEFSSYANEQDAHSGKRHYSFFNEANGIPFGIYRQVAQRTSIRTFIDFNPSSEFWAHNEVWKPKKVDELGNPIKDENGKEVREISTYPNQADFPPHMQTLPPELWGKQNVKLFKSNWRHNIEFLDKKTIDDIEKWKEIDPEYYKVYGLGEMGMIDGLVYKRVKTIPEWPDELLQHNKIVRALDFGYSEDPSTQIRIAIKDNCLYCHEEIYGKRIMNRPLANLIKRAAGDMPVWADIEPRTIAELQGLGCNIRQVAKKDKDILPGIQFVNSFDCIYVTSDSTNLRKEFANYKYKKDDENVDEKVPINRWNHCMDALRYAAMSYNKVGTMQVFDVYL